MEKNKIIVGEEKEFKEFFEKIVKPIGNSAHINMSKKFLGRIVSVIIPKDALAVWLFDRSEIDILKNEILRFEFAGPYFKQKKEELLGSVNNLYKEKFKVSDLAAVTYMVKRYSDSKEALKVIEKIERTYTF